MIAELLVTGGGEAVNSALYRSWDVSTVVELRFAGGAAGARIRRGA